MTVRANKPAFNVREKLTELAGRGKNHRAFVLLGVRSGRTAENVTAGNHVTISYDDVLQGDASLWNSTDPGGYAYYFKCPRNGHYKIDADWQNYSVPGGGWAWNATIHVGTETSYGSAYWGTYEGHGSSSEPNDPYVKAGVHGTIYCTAGQCIRIRMYVNASFSIEYSSSDARHRLSIIEL